MEQLVKLVAAKCFFHPTVYILYTLHKYIKSIIKLKWSLFCCPVYCAISKKEKEKEKKQSTSKNSKRKERFRERGGVKKEVVMRPQVHSVGGLAWKSELHVCLSVCLWLQQLSHPQEEVKWVWVDWRGEGWEVWHHIKRRRRGRSPSPLPALLSQPGQWPASLHRPAPPTPATWWCYPGSAGVKRWPKG